MNLQVDFWQLLGLFFAGIGAFWGVLKAAAAQTLARQEAAHAQLVQRLDSIESSSREEAPISPSSATSSCSAAPRSTPLAWSRVRP